MLSEEEKSKIVLDAENNLKLYVSQRNFQLSHVPVDPLILIIVSLLSTVGLVTKYGIPAIICIWFYILCLILFRTPKGYNQDQLLEFKPLTDEQKQDLFKQYEERKSKHIH